MTSALIAASSATGKSEVPAQMMEA